MTGNPQTDPTFMPGQQMQLPQQMGGLPDGPPAGAYTDAQYLASEAQLRHNITSSYADLLAQLGYVDPDTGTFIPGSVSQQAQISEDQLNQGRQLAIDQNSQNAQQQGITFSGERAKLQSQAELPYWQQIGQLEYQTPQTLADLYRRASDLINNYHTGNATLLADAASRATANIDQHPPAPPPPPTTTPPPLGGGGGTPKPKGKPRVQLPPPAPGDEPFHTPGLDPVSYHAGGLAGAIHARLGGY